MKLFPILLSFLLVFLSADLALSSPGEECDNVDGCDRGEKCTGPHGTLSNCYTLIPRNGKCGGQWQVCHAADKCEDNVCVDGHYDDSAGLRNIIRLTSQLASIEESVAHEIHYSLQDATERIIALFQESTQNGRNTSELVEPTLEIVRSTVGYIRSALSNAISGMKGLLGE
ncbi:hypothetical protein BDV34DRAFT_219563 [Aspergillus parasiticus]|uniref:Secreted protein n=1 Tax=Aspergillus parasiticus TaxID=5067 RepID=A0A5N6E2E0_ASPPA|nr:hypothetical protein BDV34DRAFT_219563 [Aspergillus parasiticus]